MLLLASSLSVSAPAMARAHEAPAPAAALHAPAFPPSQHSQLAAPRRLPAAERLALLSRRGALLRERAHALGLGLRVRAADHDRPGFAPVARQSLAQIEACPLLSEAEKRAVRLEVAIARDADEWALGRASPCYWLTVATRG